MTDNPLVATRVETATAFSGAGLLDSGSQLVSAIESGNWVEGGMAAFSTAVDTVATVSDPLGSLIAAGLGWLIDHFEPLKGWFNDLTGDAGEVQAFAATWTNIQSQLQQSGDELTRVLGDLDELAGEAMDAYRRFQTDAAQHLHGAATWAGAMATGLQVAATIVQVVHDIVRDVLSQLVGSAISWAAEAVVTVGLATPWIVEQVATRVASWTAKIGSKLTALLRSIKTLATLLEKLRSLLSHADELFASVLKGGRSAVSRVLGHEGDAVSLTSVRRFADDDEAVAYGRQAWAGLSDELTPAQRESVFDYTREAPGPSGITYAEINGALRKGPPYPAELEGHIRAIDETLARRPLTETIEVTRGTGVSHWPFTPKAAAGNTLTEDSFLSTSLGGPAQSFADKDAILHLTVPPGTPAGWVEEMSQFGGSERELLLGRGLEWRATSSELVNGQWHVYAEVVK
ncbi:ADP-ribosyltransferase exoenzyme [Microbacterium ginsengisoli]|uniref:ADP-ribosyltransferase exoenzyme n=1 Tax=Microbacterium ginsengisoli TaxID=400772 RepID=A0A0F0LTS4_9MICO|nr:ADP-ribosyltransferase [Microbacterium ginsengisoli]KJL36528.1 ADP-ribosyltransferase exoenzyme [Microbacterium ginsengisoli]